MRPIQVKHREGGVLVRDFIFNDKHYFHCIYTDNDSILLSSMDNRNTILVYDSSMNVYTVNKKGEPVTLGHFSIRDHFWVYEHKGDPEILKYMTDLVGPDCITGNEVQLEHLRYVEGHLDSEVKVSKMYLNYLASKGV